MATTNRVVFHRTVKIGTVKEYAGSRVVDAPVYCKVAIDDAGELTISGVVGPRRDGNAIGGCGQIIDTVAGIAPADLAPGWTVDLRDAFVACWRRWHLNNMRAGAPDQEALLSKHHDEVAAAGAYPGSWYDAACALLAKHGILESQSGAMIRVHGDDSDRLARGYKYGHGWVRETLPDDVRAFVAALPASPDVPAWV